MKKGYLMCIIIGFVIGSFITVMGSQAITAYRNEEIKITLNDVQQTFRDETTGELMYPIMYNNRTYLPLRNVANVAGLNVDYDSATKTAKLTTKDYVPTAKPTVQTPSTTTTTQLNTSSMKKTNTKYGISGYDYFNSLNMYIASLTSKEREQLNEMSKKTVNSMINLMNVGLAEDNNYILNQIVHSKAFDVNELKNDINYAYSKKSEYPGTAFEARNIKVVDAYINNSNDIAVQVEYELVFKSLSTGIESSGGLLRPVLLRENGELKFICSLAEDKK